MHCPGCGGDLRYTSPSYGHIIGCGYPPPIPHHNVTVKAPDWASEWDRDKQRKIIVEALKGALAKVKKGVNQGSPAKDLDAFADTLAKALWAEIPKPTGFQANYPALLKSSLNR